MKSTHVFFSARHQAAVVAALLLSLTRAAAAQSDPPAQPGTEPVPSAASSPPAATAPASPPSAPPTAAASSTDATAASSTPTNLAVSGCSLDALTSIHRDAPRFLVEVQARQGSTATTGVVIAPDRVVVPYAGVLSENWPITVYFHDGTESAARVLRVLKEENLAVLSLETPPAGLAPRSFSKTVPPFGTPVVSIGNALHDGKTVTWDVRSAYVSSTNGRLLAASPAPITGAPLLSCSGELVGVQMRKVIDESPIPGVVSAPSLSTTLATPAKNTPTGYIGIGFRSTSLVLAMRPSETGAGFRFTFAELGFAPRFFMKVNFGAQWLTVPERSEYANATDVFRWRFQMEALVGFNHRFTLGSPAEGFVHLDLSPYLGVAARTDYTNLRRLRSGLTPTTSSETLHEDHTDPLIGVSLGMLKASLSYQFQLDVKAPKQSIHTLSLGKQF